MKADVAVVSLGKAEAEQLDRDIRRLAKTTLSNLDQLIALVQQANAGDIHKAIGYPSWTAYVADALGGLLGGLDAGPQRREIVALLAGEGMSQRVIASVLDVGVGTVNRDLAAGVPGGTPALDQGSVEPETEPGHGVIDAEVVDPVPQRAITGRDGKTYPATPKRTVPLSVPDRGKPRRRSLPDTFDEHCRKLEEQIRGLTRLVGDDRFGDNREKMSLGQLRWSHNQLGMVIAAVEGASLVSTTPTPVPVSDIQAARPHIALVSPTRSGDETP
ncbi:sigma-70 region 4 domain-containing protein [Mycolicibacterium llatzerense]|uniref:sigma-70 region 4 domain-containing protein n=1 Tax=Mycolicibacterium llatzerense TaxID=280871 RepID=UPI0008DCB205|nr:sigma-70 region 4 domain-containing protein [Mycolicibacterium llatzerense]